MARTESTMLDLGTPAPDFALPDTAGNTVARADFAGRPLLVIFMCNHCPFVKHLGSEMVAFAREYQAKGLGVVAISANFVGTHPQDGPEEMVKEAATMGFTFPYLYDESQATAKAYRAACTPDFFIFDADHKLAYRGQFDTSRPGNDVPVTGNDLRAAADAVLSGGPVPAEQIPSLGCNIKWKPGNEPDYYGG